MEVNKMTTEQKIMQLLSELSPYQRLRFYKLCNQIAGSVVIPSTQEIRTLADFIRIESGGTRQMLAFSKKLFYGFEEMEKRTHYKTKNVLINDFREGKKIYINSY